MRMLPTIPATPSVALSERDRQFIQARREQIQAQRAERIQTVTERALGGAILLIWTHNLSLIFGG